MGLILRSLFGIGGIISILLGCGLAAVAATMLYLVDVKTQSWTQVNGTVTAERQTESADSDGNTSTNYCPSVRYATMDGQTLDVDLNECAAPAAYGVGSPVQILYNPENPAEAQIKGGTGSLVGNITVVVLAGVGGLGCIGGLGANLFGAFMAFRRVGK